MKNFHVGVASFAEGYDPYNTAVTLRSLVMERLAEEHAREMRATRARFGNDYSMRASHTLDQREEIARLMPWENFPDGVNVRCKTIWD